VKNGPPARPPVLSEFPRSICLREDVPPEPITLTNPTKNTKTRGSSPGPPDPATSPSRVAEGGSWPAPARPRFIYAGSVCNYARGPWVQSACVKTPAELLGIAPVTRAAGQEARFQNHHRLSLGSGGPLHPFRKQSHTS